MAFVTVQQNEVAYNDWGKRVAENAFRSIGEVAQKQEENELFS